MTRRAPRGEAVTVAELLNRSAPDGRHREPPQHREKPRALRSLARLRVFSVVAGALALTGGVATAVSMPVERGAGAAPAGLEPVAVPLVPLPGEVVVPPAKPAPESVAPSVEPGGIVPVTAKKEVNSGVTPAHRGKLAKAVKIVGKAKPRPQPKHAAPVRHVLPVVPTWSRGHHQHHGGGGHHHRCS